MKLLFIKSGCIIIAGIIIANLFSCGGNETQGKTPALLNENTGGEVSSSTKEGAAISNELYAKGEEVYNQTCRACHQANGEGLPSAFPPLAKSDYLLADKVRAINQVIKGSTGEIIVNGQKFNSTMPPINLNDEQISNVLNYVLHSWGNNGEVITVEEVKAQRGI